MTTTVWDHQIDTNPPANVLSACNSVVIGLMFCSRTNLTLRFFSASSLAWLAYSCNVCYISSTQVYNFSLLCLSNSNCLARKFNYISIFDDAYVFSDEGLWSMDEVSVIKVTQLPESASYLTTWGALEVLLFANEVFPLLYATLLRSCTFSPTPPFFLIALSLAIRSYSNLFILYKATIYFYKSASLA